MPRHLIVCVGILALVLAGCGKSKDKKPNVVPIRQSVWFEVPVELLTSTLGVECESHIYVDVKRLPVGDTFYFDMKSGPLSINTMQAKLDKDGNVIELNLHSESKIPKIIKDAVRIFGGGGVQWSYGVPEFESTLRRERIAATLKPRCDAGAIWHWEERKRLR